MANIDKKYIRDSKLNRDIFRVYNQNSINIFSYSDIKLKNVKQKENKRVIYRRINSKYYSIFEELQKI